MSSVILTVGIVLCVAVVALAAYLIPLIIQLRRTAGMLTQSLEVLNKSLPLILSNVEQITTQVRQSTLTVHTQVDQLAFGMKRVQGVLLGLSTGLEQLLPALIRLPVWDKLRTVAAIAKGVSVFLSVYRTNRR